MMPNGIVYYFKTSEDVIINSENRNLFSSVHNSLNEIIRVFYFKCLPIAVN